MDWVFRIRETYRWVIALGGGGIVGSVLKELSALPIYLLISIGVLATGLILWGFSDRSNKRYGKTKNKVNQLTQPGLLLKSEEFAREYESFDYQMRKEMETFVGKIADSAIDNEDKESAFKKISCFLFLYLMFRGIWYTIYKSQLEALKELVHQTEVIPRKNLMSHYDKAAANYPKQYENNDYDTWVQYMFDKGLIREDSGLISITIRGKEFLRFIVGRNLNENILVL